MTDDAEREADFMTLLRLFLAIIRESLVHPWGRSWLRVRGGLVEVRRRP